MSLLPDILRLLPQWLSWEDYFKLGIVCKLWHSIYSIPERVPVLLEHWGPVSLATIVIGSKALHIPSTEILEAAVEEILDDWEACYYVWWSEVHLVDVLREYKQKTTWALRNEPEECNSRCLEVNPVGDLRLKKCVSCNASEVTVKRLVGDLTRITLTPSNIDYSLAFARAMIRDVSYQRPLSSCYLSISDQGEWIAFEGLCATTGILYEQVDTQETDVFGFCIILCKRSVKCLDELYRWREPNASRLYTPLRRVIAYVLARMRELGLPLSAHSERD